MERRAFEDFRRECRQSVEPFLGHAVTAECGRKDNNPSHLVWMSNCNFHCYAAAHTVSDEVRSRDLEILEQRRNVIGVVLAVEFSWNIRRPPVTLHFDGNDFPGLGKFADPPAQLLVMVMNPP